jgi:broad specificity phosphatase PhoE
VVAGDRGVIVVVRHGRTASNASGLLLGRADPPLDELGVRQAEALGRAVGRVDRVISSPLARTRATAAFLDGPLEIDDRWIELDYGEWDERPLSEVTPEQWAHWQSDSAWAPPGGESFDQLGERVRAALGDLTASMSPDETVAVVTHVSPLKASVAWALGVPDHVAWRLFVSPASITRIPTSRGRPVLAGFNDVAHLPVPDA